MFIRLGWDQNKNDFRCEIYGCGVYNQLMIGNGKTDYT